MQFCHVVRGRENIAVPMYVILLAYLFDIRARFTPNKFVNFQPLNLSPNDTVRDYVSANR